MAQQVNIEGEQPDSSGALSFRAGSESATTQDWIDLIGLYRVIVRARTGWRFQSLEWAKTAPSVPGRGPASTREGAVSGEVWGATQNQGGHVRTGKPRTYPTYASWGQTDISRGKLGDVKRLAARAA